MTASTPRQPAFIPKRSLHTRVWVAWPIDAFILAHHMVSSLCTLGQEQGGTLCLTVFAFCSGCSPVFFSGLLCPALLLLVGCIPYEVKGMQLPKPSRIQFLLLGLRGIAGVALLCCDRGQKASAGHSEEARAPGFVVCRLVLQETTKSHSAALEFLAVKLFQHCVLSLGVLPTMLHRCRLDSPPEEFSMSMSCMLLL